MTNKNSSSSAASQAPSSEAMQGFANPEDQLTAARQSFEQEIEAKKARSGRLFPARILRPLMDARSAYIQCLLTTGRPISLADMSYMDEIARSTVACYHFDSCATDVRDALLSDENSHVRQMAERSCQVQPSKAMDFKSSGM